MIGRMMRGPHDQLVMGKELSHRISWLKAKYNFT
jgi:hypothetical protein